MADLQDFLRTTADDATPLGSVTLALGADQPFCLLRMRAFHPEDDEKQDLSITRRTYGVRSLLLSGETLEYGDAPAPDHIDARLPTLLRVAARARDYGRGGPANLLQLWHPNSDTPVTAKIVESDEAQDLLAVPEPFEDLTGQHAVHLPALRFVEGAASVSLQLDKGNQELAQFLRFDAADNTVFGGVALSDVGVSKAGEVFWQVEATPQGLTFAAKLTDPTSGLHNGPTQQLDALVRLEADADRDSYRLRLIGPAPGTPTDALADATGRLQQIVTDLITTKAPQRYRIDLREETPPLIWPLELEAGQLSLKPVPADPNYALAEIDPSHIDLRLVTTARGVGDGSAQARVEIDRVELHSSQDAFELQAFAGQPITDASYSLNFTNNSPTWTQQLIGTFGEKRVNLPVDRLRDRLTQRYSAAGLIDGETETAPYAFFALRDGWMQMPLAPRKKDDIASFATKSLSGDREMDPANALTGRLLFEATNPNQDDALPRVLELSSAQGLRITTTWQSDGAPALEQFSVEATGEAGAIYGFLFVADTSPTALEAVPDWTRGPAAVREVPLGFDSLDEREVTFKWVASQDTSDWELAFDLPADKNGPHALAWVTMNNAPFITNYPMSRSDKSAPAPSRSRGLFPRDLSGIVRMRFELSADKRVENDLPVLLGSTDTATAPGKPFGIAPEDPIGLRYMQSALLPTLHGVEFKTKPDTVDWQFTAALRFDYPALDELFAWSDLPPVEPENAQVEQVEAAQAPVVTALHPARLATLWRDAEQRMQLTWTQDAVIATNLPLNTSTDITLDTLAYPYAFEQQVKISLLEEDLFGDLITFDPDNGERSGRARAAVGLGGVLSDDEDGLDLSSTGVLPRVHVTGYGIDQYPPTVKGAGDDSAAHMLSDARGTSMRTRATRKGTLRQLRHSARVGAGRTHTDIFLHTMATPDWFSMNISGTSTLVDFHVRDLPLDEDTLAFTGMRAAASEFDSPAPNPIESYRSNTGRAFNREDFGKSLYEWRCYPQAEDNEVPGSFDIPIGPFQFRPLRLIKASFDDSDSNTPLSLQDVAILGGLSFRSDGQNGNHADFAFGPDRIYDRDDLFVFSTSSSAGWKGAAVAPGKTPDEATLQDRAPTLSFTRRLPVITSKNNGWFASESAVDAHITLNFETKNSSMTPKTATLQARLFGRDHTVSGGTVKIEGDKKDELKITFDNTATWEPALPSALQEIAMVAVCTPTGSGQSLAIDGKLEVLAKGDAGPALFSLTRRAVRWLDLGLEDANEVPWIDHTAGVLSYNLAKEVMDGGNKPLFGLPLGSPKEEALLSISLAEVLATQSDTRVFHFLADMRVGDGSQYRLNHEVLWGAHDDENTTNRLRLTWTSEEKPSPIQWRTLDGITLDGDPDQILQISQGDLTPPAYENSGAPSRLLGLNATPDAITHKVSFHLTDFLIDPSTLSLSGTQLLPLSQTLRGLAQVEHTLTEGPRKKTWWSCDFVALATPRAMQIEAGVLSDGTPQIDAGRAISFVPRQNHRLKTVEGSEALQYRGAPEHDANNSLPEGTARLENANLSGWHDPGMSQHLWQNLDAEAVFFVAIAPLWMADASGRRAHQINLPWAYGFPKGTTLQAAPLAGQDTYRVPTMETWAAHPLTSAGVGSVVALTTQMREAEMLAALSDRRAKIPQLRAMLPATPGLFEPWNANAPGGIDTPQQHARAPYFLRAMLALAAHWTPDQPDNLDAPVMSLLPDTIWQEAPDDAQPDATRHQTGTRRALLRKQNAVEKQRESAPDPVDLLVLSPTGAHVMPGYRQTLIEAKDWARPAELFDAAHRVVEDARFALFRVNAKGLAQGRSVARARDPLDLPGVALTPAAADIVASPALGWPMHPGAATKDPPAPGFEAEHALQSASAGFAARSQRTLWPALAAPPSEDSDPDCAIEAIGLRFSEHVVFDTGSAPFPHDGPAARHLAPAMARRRAPLPYAQMPRDDDENQLWAPIMAPIVDRMVIGRRPGVLDTTTASATLVRKLPRHALDSGWPGTGQPASSGPVIGAQMRNPRSPVLPPHPEKPDLFDGQSPADQMLRLSRRTYLSRADGPPEDKPLAAFAHQPYLSDTLRITDSNGVEWRLTLSGAGRTIALPSTRGWDGRLSLWLIARAVDTSGNSALSSGNLETLFDIGSSSDPIERRVSVQLYIGQRNWQLKIHSGYVFNEGIEIHAGFSDTSNGKAALADVNDQLGQADADTPLHLALAFSSTDGVSTSGADGNELPRAGLARFKLPVVLSPRGPRNIPTATETLSFGDPSYDRALASPTLTAPLNIGATTRMMVALDRQQANPDTQMHIAFDELDAQTGGFKPGDGTAFHKLHLTFTRIPFRADDKGDSPPKQDLLLANPTGRPSDLADFITRGNAAILNLADLFVPQYQNNELQQPSGGLPLQPGDILRISCKLMNGDTLLADATLNLPIVARPVVPPAPSVFTFIEELATGGGADAVAARVRLHASAPLPTRVEYPDLLGDMGRGHVRRQGLFVWHYGLPEPAHSPISRTQHLLKIDRSGGTQLPEEKS